MKRRLKIFLVIFLFYPILFLGGFFFQKELEKYLVAEINQPLENIHWIEIPKKPKKPPLEIEAKSALSLKTDLNDLNKILFEKEAEKPLPIASLTKLMTALIVFEENYDLESQINISQKAASQEDPPFGSLIPGQKLKIKELLDLMLIYSSNDAAWALSEVIGVSNFLEKMNQKAQELGLEDTHFFNPHGLDPKNGENFNYSSAKDLAKLTQYILKERPEIFEISRQSPKYPLENGIFNLFLTDEIIGGKTGYTKKSGGCILFVFRDQKGNIFINIVLGTQSEEARIKEMQKLIDWLKI